MFVAKVVILRRKTKIPRTVRPVLRVKSSLYAFDHKVYGVDRHNEKLHDWMLKEGFTMLVRTSDKYCRWAESLIATPMKNEAVKSAYLFSCFCGLRISI